jgi:hypothetical protein
LVAVAFLAIGSFTLLIGQTELIGGVLIAFGLLASFVTVRINSKAQIRTRFESATFGVFDIVLVIISGALLISAVLGWFP